jgi:surfeit locus 1 family protein
MRLGGFELSVALLPAVATLLMLALLVWAGLWQLDRAEEKRALAAEQAYRGAKSAIVLLPGLLDDANHARLRHRQSSALGQYRGDTQYLLDNRTHAHVAGYHVLTPFRLQGSNVHVLVNRGWLPVGPDRRRLPDLSVNPQQLTVQGMIVDPPAPGLALGASGYDEGGWPKVIQRVDFARIQEQLDSPLLPFMVRLSAASEHGYERDWKVQTGLSPQRHVGYAVQWFALAAALLALSVWVAVKRAPANP